MRGFYVQFAGTSISETLAEFIHFLLKESFYVFPFYLLQHLRHLVRLGIVEKDKAFLYVYAIGGIWYFQNILSA